MYHPGLLLLLVWYVSPSLGLGGRLYTLCLGSGPLGSRWRKHGAGLAFESSGSRRAPAGVGVGVGGGHIWIHYAHGALRRRPTARRSEPAHLRSGVVRGRSCRIRNASTTKGHRLELAPCIAQSRRESVVSR